MNETTVTLAGWVGGEVTLREVGESTMARFRVACTPRRWSRRTEEWFDADTQWFTVTAWRQLADNLARSIGTGDPIVVHGRLNAQTWTNSAGIEVTSFDVDAMFVGHDLAKGTSDFTRNERHRTGEVRSESEAGGDAAASGESAA